MQPACGTVPACSPVRALQGLLVPEITTCRNRDRSKGSQRSQTDKIDRASGWANVFLQHNKFAVIKPTRYHRPHLFLDGNQMLERFHLDCAVDPGHVARRFASTVLHLLAMARHVVSTRLAPQANHLGLARHSQSERPLDQPSSPLSKTHATARPDVSRPPW